MNSQLQLRVLCLINIAILYSSGASRNPQDLPQVGVSNTNHFAKNTKLVKIFTNQSLRGEFIDISTCVSLKDDKLYLNIGLINTFRHCVMLYNLFNCNNTSDMLAIVSYTDEYKYFKPESLGPCRANCSTSSLYETGATKINPNIYDSVYALPSPVETGECVTLYEFKRDHFYLSHQLCIELYKGRGCTGESQRFNASSKLNYDSLLKKQTYLRQSTDEGEFYIEISPEWHYIQSLSLCGFICIGPSSQKNNGMREKRKELNFEWVAENNGHLFLPTFLLFMLIIALLIREEL